MSTFGPRLLSSRRDDLGPFALRQAPELACLVLLDDALAIAAKALSAQLGTLFHDCDPHEPPSLRAARRLISHATDLRRAIHRYRRAVLLAIGVSPTPDDDELF